MHDVADLGACDRLAEEVARVNRGLNRIVLQHARHRRLHSDLVLGLLVILHIEATGTADALLGKLDVVVAQRRIRSEVKPERPQIFGQRLDKINRHILSPLAGRLELAGRIFFAKLKVRQTFRHGFCLKFTPARRRHDRVPRQRLQLRLTGERLLDEFVELPSVNSALGRVQ